MTTGIQRRREKIFSQMRYFWPGAASGKHRIPDRSKEVLPINVETFGSSRCRRTRSSSWAEAWERRSRCRRGSRRSSSPITGTRGRTCPKGQDMYIMARQTGQFTGHTEIPPYWHLEHFFLSLNIDHWKFITNGLVRSHPKAVYQHINGQILGLLNILNG